MFKLIHYVDENQKVKYGLLCLFLTHEKKRHINDATTSAITLQDIVK